MADRFLVERLWDYLSYSNRHKILSAVERDIDVFYDGEKILSLSVPETVFNPYKGSAPAKVIELILEEKIAEKEIQAKHNETRAAIEEARERIKSTTQGELINEDHR